MAMDFGRFDTNLVFALWFDIMACEVGNAGIEIFEFWDGDNIALYPRTCGQNGKTGMWN